MKIIPASIATTTPTILGSMLKDFEKALPMEFACTIFPIKPRASIIVIAKNIDSTFAIFLFFKPFLM